MTPAKNLSLFELPLRSILTCRQGDEIENYPKTQSRTMNIQHSHESDDWRLHVLCSPAYALEDNVFSFHTSTVSRCHSQNERWR
eukprot:scaffold37528_cov45-Attheya_sp.AAC.1